MFLSSSCWLGYTPKEEEDQKTPPKGLLLAPHAVEVFSSAVLPELICSTIHSIPS